MGYTTSTVHGIEVPDSSEANNVPEDIGKVVTALEAGSIVKRLTGAQISALTSPQKPAGLLVYNTTTNKLQISDGANFADVDATAVSALGIANAALPKAGGTMSGAIAMGSNKVTGLTKGTSSGEAVARQQIQSGTTGSISAGGSEAVSFSPAFASAPKIVCVPTANLGTTGRFWITSVSTTGATINQNNVDLTASTFMWIAVGD